MDKTKRLNLRVSEDEKLKIEKLAKSHKMTISQFLLHQSLNKELKLSQVLYLEQSTKFLLSNIANNMNQIAHELNRQQKAKLIFDRFDYEKRVNEIVEVISKIKEVKQ